LSKPKHAIDQRLGSRLGKADDLPFPDRPASTVQTVEKFPLEKLRDLE
jgi:hypothetical protein